MTAEPLPLPVAQRCEEVPEEAFEALIRIAQDDQVEAGRLKRVPRKVPVRDRKAAES